MSVIVNSLSGPRVAAVDGLGEHHRERRHALAMAARIRRFVVDRRVDHLDERLEQIFEVVDQQPIRERDRRLRRERFREPLIGFGERLTVAASRGPWH